MNNNTETPKSADTIAAEVRNDADKTVEAIIDAVADQPAATKRPIWRSIVKWGLITAGAIGIGIGAYYAYDALSAEDTSSSDGDAE